TEYPQVSSAADWTEPQNVAFAPAVSGSKNVHFLERSHRPSVELGPQERDDVEGCPPLAAAPGADERQPQIDLRIGLAQPPRDGCNSYRWQIVRLDRPSTAAGGDNAALQQDGFRRARVGGGRGCKVAAVRQAQLQIVAFDADGELHSIRF